MSAFPCSPEHIGRIAVFTARRDRWDKRTAQDYAELWARANLDSVAYRYDDLGAPDRVAQQFLGYEQDIGAADAYVQDCKRAATKAQVYGPSLEPVEAYKMLQCLDYQSCEVSDWLGSEAERTIAAAKDRAVGAMPGYDAAPWEYCTPQTSETPAS